MGDGSDIHLPTLNPTKNMQHKNNSQALKGSVQSQIKAVRVSHQHA